MKYLITGIEGFVGGYLAEELLSPENEVYGTYFDETTLIEKVKQNCTLRQLDIRDEELLLSFIQDINPDAIFHLAAQSSAAVSWKKPQLTIDINTIGMINLLECTRNASPHSRIIAIGSSEEYGIVKAEDNPICEDYPLSPNSPYSVSKATCEELCRLYVNAYNMDIVMTRSFNHTGIRQSTKFVMADFSKRIAEISAGKRAPVLEVGNLEAKRDFTDVRDIVKAYIVIQQKGKCGEVYNVGSGISDSIQNYLNYMIQREGLKVDIIRDEKRMRPSDNPVICCDNAKLKDLGWNKTIDIHTTINEMIDSWKADLS